jgi:hypothetical protein
MAAMAIMPKMKKPKASLARLAWRRGENEMKIGVDGRMALSNSVCNNGEEIMALKENLK